MNTGTFLKTALIILAFSMAAITAVGADVNSFLTEDFETAFENGAPPGWTKSYKTGTIDWVQEAGDRWIGDTAHGGKFNALLCDNDSSNDETYLITPAINFPADTNSAVLEFWHKQPVWAGSQDTLQVRYRTTAAGLWVDLATYSSNVDKWTKRTIALPNLSPTYYIAFLGNAKYGYGVCIDDVNVHEANVADAPDGGNVTDYYAVICGVSDYLVLEDLSYCDNDARDVRDALLGLGSWKSANITVLVDSNATKAAIAAAVQNMAQKADEDDVCLFYFSGHGMTGDDLPPIDESDGKDEYLAPYDSLADSYDNDIRDDELADLIAALPTNKYVVIIDSCFSAGQFKALAGAQATRAVKGLGNIAPQKGDGFTADFTSAIRTKDLAKTIQTKDLGAVERGVVISSSDDDELSEESSELQNGVFTYYLVEGLTGLADLDGDGGISAEECFAYARPLAASYNSGQNAQMSDNFPGELYLTVSSTFIGKCTVKAGSVEGADTISAAGEISAAASDFEDATNITVAVDSNDLNVPCVLTFPVDGNTFKKARFSCSKTENGVKKSFKYDTKTHKFSFSAGKIDLSGLSCPFTVDIEIGDYNTTMTANETIVNGKSPIPIKLMTGVKNSLRVDKIQVKQGKPDSDQLTVKGGFAVEADVNMVDVNFVAELEGQKFTIPAGLFRAGKGKFSCSKVIPNEGGAASADFNFKKCTFTFTIKQTEIAAGHGATDFKIEFGDFSESVDVVLP